LNTQEKTLENVKGEIAYLEGVVRLMDEAGMARIDFDELCERLQAISVELAALDKLVEGHALLRQDCEQRIAGMIKAIAAVDRKRDGWSEALVQVEELPTLAPARLLVTYRRVAARFRDCFPGSFGTPSPGGRRYQPDTR
jgi:hypothetical protein